MKKSFVRVMTLVLALVMLLSLVACGGKLSTAKEHGWLRSEGKDYEVKDGDICHFLFNV